MNIKLTISILLIDRNSIVSIGSTPRKKIPAIKNKRSINCKLILAFTNLCKRKLEFIQIKKT